MFCLIASLSMSLLTPLHGRSGTTQTFAGEDILRDVHGSLSRKTLLHCATFGSLACHYDAAKADELPVLNGILQTPQTGFTLPDGASATITLRIVGRNTKGPIATIVLPVGGMSLPVNFAVTRQDMREGLQDFIWLEDDIYLKADVASKSGKVLLTGRSKSKAISENGKPAHATAYVTIEP